ncbi:SH3 domain-containing protein [Tessaracoccus sp.]
MSTTRLRAALRRGIAPAAIMGLLVVTTTLTFVPMGAGSTPSAAVPAAFSESRMAYPASRDFVRPPMPSASPALDNLPVTPVLPVAPVPTPSPAAPAPVLSQAASPSPTASAPTPAAPTTTAAVPPVAPVPDWSVKGEAAGSRWSTSSVNVRTGPGTGYDVVTALASGREVDITASQHDGWQQVSLKDGVGWVKATFLTSDTPVQASQKAPAATKSASSGSAGRCARAGGAESGMTSRTVAVLRKVCAQFSSITSYGGYRAGSDGYHGSGRAIDAMISGDAGWEVARWVRANASSLGVVEVIYQQKIWTSQRSGDGWRSMSSRGSASANHFDHVHISVG